MKNTISFLFILLVFKLQMPETLDATLAELNFHGGQTHNLIAFKCSFYFTATDGYYNEHGERTF
jgi:hypothetical protein